LSELDAVIARCEKTTLRSWSVGAVLFTAARELSVHGYRDEAKAMATRAAAWYRTRLETVTPTTALRDSYADALIHAGECKHSVRIRRDLMHEAPNNLSYRSQYATALVRCGGSRDEARRIADAFGKMDPPFLHGQQFYHRARILAALGDGDGAVRALEASISRGWGFSNLEMHLNYAWDPIRDHPPFVEWMKPKG